MQLVEITSPDQCAHEELRARACTSSKNKHTRHHIVRLEAQEVAFVSLDVIPNAEYLVLYELFVVQARRQQGVGSHILMEVERLAVQLGYQLIALTPWPLESTLSETQLKQWYKQRGYVPRCGVPSELQKRLRPKSK